MPACGGAAQDGMTRLALRCRERASAAEDVLEEDGSRGRNRIAGTAISEGWRM
jgi:hypothetical protein